MSRELRVWRKVLRAAVDVLDAELDEDAPEQFDGASPESSTRTRQEPANDLAAREPTGKRRKGVRPVYRPQGPVDEVSARRADEALKRAGLPRVPPRRK